MFKKSRLFCLWFQNKWHSTEIQRLEVLGCTQTKLTVRVRECTILSWQHWIVLSTDSQRAEASGHWDVLMKNVRHLDWGLLEMCHSSGLFYFYIFMDRLFVAIVFFSLVCMCAIKQIRLTLVVFFDQSGNWCMKMFLICSLRSWAVEFWNPVVNLVSVYFSHIATLDGDVLYCVIVVKMICSLYHDLMMWFLQ